MAVRFEGLRGLARNARRLPERLLHPRRRRRARRLLRSLGRPRNVLVLCHGNICRSPFVAAVARRLLPPETRVASAGFIGPDRPSPPEAIVAAKERGYDLAPHRSRLVTPALLDAAELIIVLDPMQRLMLRRTRPPLAAPLVLLGDLDPAPIQTRGIPDPVNQPVETFRASYARAERCMVALCKVWEGVAAGV